MRGIGIVSFGICSLLLLPARASDLEDIVESSFRQAIVKIDVSTVTPVIKDNVNICVGEGTGFIVSSTHVVTAEHVYQLAPECGERIILVKSRSHNLQKLAKVVAAKDDVALLEVDTGFPEDMCALALLGQDVYDTKAIRFGIPGGFSEPPGAVGVKIGKKASEFSPLIVMLPTRAEKGESGGPVVYQFNVVGLTRAQHDRYPSYSFMTVGSTIRALLAANSIQLKGHICNPVESSMWPTPPSGTESRVDPKTGKIIASIKVDDRLTGANSAISTTFINDLNKKLSGSSVTVTTAGNNVEVSGKVTRASEERAVSDRVATTSAEVAEHLKRTLWDRYVAEAEKFGKWNDVDALVAEQRTRDRVNSQVTGQAAGGVRLTSEQRTKITEVIRKEHVSPVDRVNFSVSVGTRVPTGIPSHPVPAEVQAIHPEWRDFKYILIRDQIVVIDPHTQEIVAVLDA